MIEWILDDEESTKGEMIIASSIEFVASGTYHYTMPHTYILLFQLIVRYGGWINRINGASRQNGHKKEKPNNRSHEVTRKYGKRRKEFNRSLRRVLFYRGRWARPIRICLKRKRIVLLDLERGE